MRLIFLFHQNQKKKSLMNKTIYLLFFNLQKCSLSSIVCGLCVRECEMCNLKTKNKACAPQMIKTLLAGNS